MCAKISGFYMLDTKSYYDDIPYFSDAFKDFSPVRLAAILKLCGFSQTPLAKARVLEIGCSYGGNIFPFATAFPNASVVGLDISSIQIKKAKEIKSAMGLKNIKFIQADISKLSQDDYKKLGEFDFILAHGVFSWVSDDIKSAMMAAISRLLAPFGVAEISYNVYPGWIGLSAVREFMLFSTASEPDYKAKVQKSAKELEFLSEFYKFNLNITSKNEAQKISTANQSLLLEQVDFVRGLMGKVRPSYISHEFFEPSNTPLYFREFNEYLSKNGLAYLLDSGLEDIFNKNLGVPMFDAYVNEHYSSRLEKEQLNDFLFNRSFRKSLVMKRSALLGTGANPERLKNGKDPDSLDFDIEIDAINMLDIHIKTKLKKEGESFYFNKLRLKPEYNWIYDAFVSVYPSSISLNMLLSALGSGAEQSQSLASFLGILELLASTQPALSPYNLVAIEYEVGRTGLSKQALGYFSYFAKNEEKLISAANELNEMLKIDEIDAFLALGFDGKNDHKAMLKRAKEAGLNIAPKELEKKISQVEKLLMDNYFFKPLKDKNATNQANKAF